MRKYSLTDAQIQKLKADKRNLETPYKAIASGETQPLRFSTELEALTFFHKHNGRCIVSHNTAATISYIAYKYS